MRKAARLIPSLVSSQSPISAVPASTRKVMRQASQAILRRVAVSMPSVKPIKMGPSPTGSTTTKRVMKDEIRIAIMEGS